MRSLLLCALLLAPASAPADEASHRQAAEDLLRATGADRMMDQFMAIYRNSLAQGFRQAGGTAEHGAILEKYSEEMSDLMSDVMSWERLQEPMVDIYVAEFTESELREIVDFYQTPTGRKAIEKMPQMMQAGAQVAQRRLEESGAMQQAQDIGRRMAEELMAARKGAETPPQP